MRFWSVLVVVAVLWVAPGFAQNPAGNALSPQRLEELATTKPKDADDLLVRAIQAVRSDLFFQEAYQSDAFLRSFFGSRELDWDPGWRMATPRDFRHLFPGRAVETYVVQALIHFDFERQPKPNVAIGLTFMPDVPLPYEKVVELFGSAWRPMPDGDLPPPQPNPHRIYPAPTHPFGNAKVTLNLSDAAIFRTVDLEFHPNGSLDSFYGFSYRRP